MINMVLRSTLGYKDNVPKCVYREMLINDRVVSAARGDYSDDVLSVSEVAVLSNEARCLAVVRAAIQRAYHGKETLKIDVEATVSSFDECLDKQLYFTLMKPSLDQLFNFKGCELFQAC